MPNPATPSAVVADLVTANRILAFQGILDGYGHMTARCEDDPSLYYIADATPPGNVVAERIFRWDFDGNPAGHSERTYGEKYIHGQIYRARSDVNAVVHCHAPEVIPFGAAGIPLRPIYHMAGFLGEEPVPVFEIRDRFGLETNMLVRSNEQGVALAESLGDRPMVLMRGHGATIVGATVREALWHAVYAVLNARILTQTLLLGGKPTYINATEGRNIENILQDGYRTWEYLSRISGAG